MAKVWSFNTTVRNPERILFFLKILKALEGVTFDEIGQEKFFAEQIKKRLYQPTKKTLVDPELINTVYAKTDEEIPDEIVSRIVSRYTGRVNAAGRGRTAAGILNRFGLCVAVASKGAIRITNLGNKWLQYKIQDQELFFKFLLKWQYPNKIEQGYSSFNIKPFIGSILLLNEVNKKWSEKGYKPVGVSRLEFAYFFPALTLYSQVKDYASEIVKFRIALKDLHGQEKKAYQDSYCQERIHIIFSSSGDVTTKQRDLKDYTDSAIRYFRMSGFIVLRGEGNYVDLSPDRKVEIENLVNSHLVDVKNFNNFEEYLTYLVDSNLPQLPWENEKDLTNIKEETIEAIKTLSIELNKQSQTEIFVKSINNLSLKNQILKLEEYKNNLQISKLSLYKYNKDKLLESIRGINGTLSDRTPTLTTRPSLDLEWFTSISLMVINDAKNIKPSYSMGDDGLPTGFKSNISDIECLYNNFGMTVEVTLQTGRDQWVSEGQPVMRHLRDFENSHKEYGNNTYCVFVASYLHRDTLNTFWNSVKGIGYEGRQQRIIPLTIGQFTKVLTYLYKYINFGHTPISANYQKLLDSLYQNKETSNDVYKWLACFDNEIDSWYSELH